MMKLSLNELRSIVADIVNTEMKEAIDRAVERKMSSVAAAIVAEAARFTPTRSAAAPDPRHIQPRDVPRRVTKTPPPRSQSNKSIMEDVLRDTAQTTLLAQRDDAPAEEAAPIVASDKFERLAFAGNAMPTRSSTVPQLGAAAQPQ